MTEEEIEKFKEAFGIVDEGDIVSEEDLEGESCPVPEECLKKIYS